MADNIIDFDAEPLSLVEAAWEMSCDYQTERNEKYKSDFLVWNCFHDETDRDPDRANIYIPKIYSIIETKVPREVKSLFGTRPYIPLEAKRKEFRECANIQALILDEYLDMGNLFVKSTFAIKLKMLYGTSFIELLPQHEMVKQKFMVTDELYGMSVGTRIIEKEVPRLSFKITTFAPWEIYVDPFAVNLEEKGGCRYVIKFQLCSKNELRRLYEVGAYPNLDINKLDQVENNDTSKKNDHWGLQMLESLGLRTPQTDDDMGILMRYESERRYIDVWNGEIVLRDIPNPFRHGLINLTRFVHIQSPNTQNQFWGIGEVKHNEVLQAMLNDSWNMTFDNHNMANQMVIYYKQNRVNPDSLVRTPANRVAVENLDAGERISDVILESTGGKLPADHYMIPETVERMIDLTSGLYNVQRGETDTSDKTLGEAAMLKEAGDIRTELSVKIGEQTFLKDLALKGISHIEQFATPDDIIEIVGEEDANKLISLNPNDLPGRFNYAFKGSDKVTNMLIKQRNMKDLTPYLMQIPNVMPGWWARKLLEAHELDSLDIDEGIIPDEMMMQIQALQQQKEAQNQMDMIQLKSQSKINSGGKEAQTSGREYNRLNNE